MGATAALNKAVLGLGLVIGVAQTASAQTYVGTYSGADHGNITIQIDANGAVSCSLASAAGNGNYAGKGGVVPGVHLRSQRFSQLPLGLGQQCSQRRHAYRPVRHSGNGQW